MPTLEVATGAGFGFGAGFFLKRSKRETIFCAPAVGAAVAYLEEPAKLSRVPSIFVGASAAIASSPKLREKGRAQLSKKGGCDPFGLGKKPEDFAKYQAFELIHARWAMLGAAGFIIPEALNKFGANCGPEAVWFKTGALLLDGNTLNYFGNSIPINLILAVVAEVVLVGGAEYYRITNGLEFDDKLHPGGPFDPLGLATDPDQAALLKVKEIKNGRLAMFSMLGFFIQAYVTGEGPFENLCAHLSDPFGNNLLTVISGAAERVPSL